ncbi:MAG TPA: hypothetical protein VEP68_00560 [Anaeromyxobacteraceae bacterium]|nr:hypothetical protein [Anaeromyxobacteraceae bacterium]
MYAFLLALHSLVRWVVVAAAVQALAIAWTGWLSPRPFTPLGRRSAAILTGALDLQILVGLALYFLASPITRTALSSFGAAMGEPQVRYWLVEHPVLALLAAALAHVGSVRARRAVAEVDRWRRAAAFFTAAAVAVAATVPWPFRAVHRPLWPW